MNTTSKKVIVYGLRDKATGELLRLEATPNESYTSREEFQYKLQLSSRHTKDLPVFEVDLAEKAAYAATVSTPWYSSTKEKPSWGWGTKPQLDVVEIIHTTSVTAVEAEFPVVFGSPADITRKPRIILRRYMDFPPDNNDTVFKVFILPLPAGETLESLTPKCRSKTVIVGTDGMFTEHALGLFAPTDEYASYLSPGQPGIVLVTRDDSVPR